MFAPLIVWALAFLVWLYWNDIAKSLSPGKDHQEPAAKTLRKFERDDTRDASDETRPEEKILEADREKLDDIIRKRNR